MTIKTPATPIHSITRLNSAIARWRSCSMCAILRHLFRYCEMFVWIARWLCDTLSADFDKQVPFTSPDEYPISVARVFLASSLMPMIAAALAPSAHDPFCSADLDGLGG